MVRSGSGWVPTQLTVRSPEGARHMDGQGRDPAVRRHSDRLDRGGGRLTPLALAAAGACLALSVPASDARPVVSRQYQANTGDITAMTGPAGPVADPLVAAPRVAARPDLTRRPSMPANGMFHAAAVWYRTRNWQYQLPKTITSTVRTSRSAIWGQIDSDTSRDNPRTRWLAELGLAFALVYVLFLVGWFWWTRSGLHGVRRVVRS